MALLNALHAFKREFVSSRSSSPRRRASIEIDSSKEPIGKQDQYIAAFGGITAFTLRPGRHASTSSASRCSDEVLDELESNLLIFYSGVERAASAVLTEQGEDVVKADKDDAVERMHRIKEIGLRDAPAAARRRHRSATASCSTSTGCNKRKLASNMTDPVIDEHYEAARKAGAIGGKLMGAGGGGFFMFYVRPRTSAESTRACRRAACARCASASTSTARASSRTCTEAECARSRGPTRGIALALSVALAGCSTHYQPLAGPRVSVVLDSGNPAYVRGGKTYSHGFAGGGLVDAVGDDPEAREAAETYHSRMTTGLVLTLVGTACLLTGTVMFTSAIASDRTDTANDSHSTRDALTVGALLCAAGTVIAGSVLLTTAQPYQWDAINIYNDHAEQRRAPPPWPYANGAGPLVPRAPVPAPPPAPPPPPPPLPPAPSVTPTPAASSLPPGLPEPAR